MDDEVVGGWHMDPHTRAALRLDGVHKALEAGDFGTAVIECEELLDDDPEHPEALFLLAEALLELGDAEGAREVYEQLLELIREGARTIDPARIAASTAGLAVARFESCDILGALEAGREAVRLAPDLAEAHFYLGLALERAAHDEPDRAQWSSLAVGEFLAAHQLDPEAYPLPLSIPLPQWKELLQAANQRIPVDIRRFWENVPMNFERYPPLEELLSHDPPITPTASGLCVGELPLDADPDQIRPQALRFFIDNLSRLGTLERIVDELALVLVSESNQWHGIDPE